EPRARHAASSPPRLIVPTVLSEATRAEVLETPRANDGPRAHSLWLEAAVVILVAAVAAVATTWPLVTELGNVAHDAFDAVVQAWTLDWVQHAIRSPGHVFDANIFAPQPATLAYSDSL